MVRVVIWSFAPTHLSFPIQTTRSTGAPTPSGDAPSPKPASCNLAATLKTNDPATDWRVAPIPVQQASDKPYNYAGGSALVIPSTSKYPKEALDFILWLTSREGQALKFGSLPCASQRPPVFVSMEKVSEDRAGT